MRYPRIRSSSATLDESHFSTRMIFRSPATACKFARLREIAVNQLEVLGGLHGLVAVGRPIALGHHVSRQRRQQIRWADIRRYGGHSGKGAQGSRNRNGGPFLGALPGPQGKAIPAGRGRRLQVPPGGVPIAGQQVEISQPARHGSGPGRVSPAQDRQQLAIGVAGARIAIPLQKLGVVCQRAGVVRARLDLPRQRGARACHVARRLHFAYFVGILESPDGGDRAYQQHQRQNQPLLHDGRPPGQAPEPERDCPMIGDSNQMEGVMQSTRCTGDHGGLGKYFRPAMPASFLHMWSSAFAHPTCRDSLQ